VVGWVVGDGDNLGAVGGVVVGHDGTSEENGCNGETHVD
jgi:hypothetical protein